jgi:hypothetical protein
VIKETGNVKKNQGANIASTDDALSLLSEERSCIFGTMHFTGAKLPDQEEAEGVTFPTQTGSKYLFEDFACAFCQENGSAGLGNAIVWFSMLGNDYHHACMPWVIVQV